jgi:glycosyltransferase involved in cell wall biosynthesis
VTRVSLELAEALGRRGDCELVPLTPYRRGPFRRPRSPAVWLPGCARLPGLLALGGPLLALVAKRHRLDLIHDPTGASPFTLGRWAGRFGRVLTIHDAIAFVSPESYPLANRVLHRWVVPATLRNVDLVVTASEHAASDLQRHLGLPRDRLAVVPNGVSERFRPDPASNDVAVRARLGLDRPYLLSVGARQARKNLGRLLEAFAQARLAREEYTLALAGPTQWGGLDLERLVVDRGLAGRVRLLGYVAESDLPAVYRGASAFLFPSLYEGFGLPVLEAMACGVSVICSNTSSLPEVAGDAALLVDPTDVAAMAAALDELLGSPALRRDLTARGVARAAGFRWEQAAERMVGLYRQVLAARR